MDLNFLFWAFVLPMLYFLPALIVQCAHAEIVEQSTCNGGLADATLVGTDKNDSWFSHGSPRKIDAFTGPLSGCNRFAKAIAQPQASVLSK